jgi:hypothetical protein
MTWMRGGPSIASARSVTPSGPGSVRRISTPPEEEPNTRDMRIRPIAQSHRRRPGRFGLGSASGFTLGSGASSVARVTFSFRFGVDIRDGVGGTPAVPSPGPRSKNGLALAGGPLR